jgi:hypothetical protein
MFLSRRVIDARTSVLADVAFDGAADMDWTELRRREMPPTAANPIIVATLERAIGLMRFGADIVCRPFSAHDLVWKNEKRPIDNREQRAYHQTLKRNHEPEQRWALVSQQHHAHAHLYFHRSQTVEQLARHQHEREKDGKEHRDHRHRCAPPCSSGGAAA